MLRTTQLPIPADRFAPRIAATTGRCDHPTLAWWAEAMRGQDFRTEDHLDTAAFNAALWRGLGFGVQPSERDQRELRAARLELLEKEGVGCSR